MISLLELGSKITPQKDSIEIGMTGVHIFPIENSRDVRGSLAIVDFTNFTPFAPQRIFYTFDVPPGQDRGNHAPQAMPSIPSGA